MELANYIQGALSFPYPDLDRIKILKHVYTDILSPRALWIPTWDLDICGWCQPVRPDSLHLGTLGGVPNPLQTRRTADTQGRGQHQQHHDSGVFTDRRTITEPSARACVLPTAWGTEAHAQRSCLEAVGTPLGRSSICACAGRAEAPTGYLGRCCPGVRHGPRAGRVRTHARTYARRASAELRALRVYAEKGEGRRCPFRRGRRVGGGVCVRKVLRWPQRDGATAPTLGQTPPAAGRGRPCPFGAAPGRDA